MVDHSIREKKKGKNPVTRFLVTPLPVTPLRVLLTTAALFSIAKEKHSIDLSWAKVYSSQPLLL